MRTRVGEVEHCSNRDEERGQKSSSLMFIHSIKTDLANAVCLHAWHRCPQTAADAQISLCQVGRCGLHCQAGEVGSQILARHSCKLHHLKTQLERSLFLSGPASLQSPIAVMRMHVLAWEVLVSAFAQGCSL